MKQKYILFMLFSLFFSKAVAQTNYSVASIPFQQYTGTLSALITGDDLYSPIIALPFNFDFYGVTYNQIVISTNGFINFTSTNAGQFSPWSFNSEIPNSNFPVKNSLLGCYEDLNNSSGIGTITYGTYGITPYRKFVVYFNNQPHFQCNSTAISSFQMILSETSNTIDVQIIDRQACSTWNGGRGVVGLINTTGTLGITPPGRNTGNWTAITEGWRFSRAGYYSTYSFVKCDDNTDGIQVFDLSVAAGDLSVTPDQVSFYESITDAQISVNPILNNYTNLSNPQTIYAASDGIIRPIVLSVVDCTIDFDNDTVATSSEDINSDTNLANNDTDADGIPNYLDNDDDGDLVLTNVEYVFARTNNPISADALLDTDNDGILNYLDNDDDGDGLLTWKEDYNNDGNPANDDTNSNGIPDYLEQGVALGVANATLVNTIELYPNPASTELNISSIKGELISNIAVYSINGSLVKEIKSNNSAQNISVSDLQSGMYFIRVTSNDKISNLKFIKK
ncbi:T9SS type A sorting domain-containing protein [Flavobacterium sp.]|uniref:T9SS type A sorting domain-containing protein n=1 Tax=Flavobacterium sp. TaxID=239 RepID=UPI002488AEF2|nr:T9SS type A sorting domain-containing protein [Flavobacterium sp.]MDI1318486.1 T9SS type A sorting domain-containing protein [Flavobacterium sp.]